jgi:hypothetical protein
MEIHVFVSQEIFIEENNRLRSYTAAKPKSNVIQHIREPPVNHQPKYLNMGIFQKYIWKTETEKPEDNFTDYYY